ncbi:MAG TPA: protease complex subunit PrcB family protein [Pyrinomonadaceae bacterium]
MSNFKLSLVTVLILFGLSGAGARSCAARQPDGKPAGNESSQKSGSAEVVGKRADGKPGEMNVLAEGSYGQGDPFVVVTRDPKVYATLRQMIKGLPELNADFFKSNTVAAVCVGPRNTGGYAVEFTRTDKGQLLVEERVPPSDSITTQAFTTPFKAVSIPTKEGETVALLLRGVLAESLLRPYRVVSGEFASSPGSGVRAEKFGVGGELRVARHERLVTVLFDLKGAGDARARSLQIAVSGVVDEQGRFTLAGGNSGSLFGTPPRLLSVTGQFAGGDGDKLTLSFKSLPAGAVNAPIWAGELSAAASGPAPARSRPNESVY